MPVVADVTFEGQSGTAYRFDVYPVTARFRDIGAVYLFTRRESEAGSFVHTPLRVGQTERLGARIRDHEEWPVLREAGCNCICVLSVASEVRRVEIETDLRRAHPMPFDAK